MSDIDIPEEVGDYIEAEHVETVFDGFIDTINGTEGMTLTSAQVYLNGVMMANGMMTGRQRVGNEGIFETIGDGIKKVWEYIKSLFRKIFGGEKKKDAQAQTKKLEDKIEKTEEKLKNAEKPPEIKSHADLDKFMGVVEKSANKAPPSQAKNDLDKGIKETKQKIDDLHAKADKAAQNMGKDSYRDFMPPELKAAIEKLLEKSFQANLYNKQKQTEADTRLKASIEKLKLIKERYEKGDDHGDLGGTIQRYINGMTGLDPIDKVHDFDTANAWVAKVKRCKEAMGNTRMEIYSSQDAIKRQIETLEGKINHFDKGESQDALSKEINGLKERLADIVNVENHFAVISVELGNMVDTIEKACVEVVVI